MCRTWVALLAHKLRLWLSLAKNDLQNDLLCFHIVKMCFANLCQNTVINYQYCVMEHLE